MTTSVLHPLFRRLRSFLRRAACLALILSALSLPKTLAADGEMDPTFVSDLKSGGSSGSVLTPALVLPDGKIYATGQFSTNAGGVTRVRNARLQPDGATDSAFAVTMMLNASAIGAACAVVQPDGKIVVGGGFSTVDGITRIAIARLNTDGSLDSSFVPATIASSAVVASLALQPDGKIIILGFFSSVGGEDRTRIARLNPDGSLDTGFNPVFVRDGFPSPNLNVVAVQPDGKILVGGVFTSVNGDARTNFARLNSDGTTDALTLDTDNSIAAIMVETDGRFTAGGSFTTARGLPYAKLVRVNPDGSLDGTFTPAATPHITNILTMALQLDGRILVGGNGVVGNPGPLARFNADGSLDPSYTVPAELRHVGGAMSCVVQQLDGRILVGRTVSANPTPDDNPLPLVRLQNGASAQAITVEATRVRWLRSGPVPEVRDTLFQLSTNNGASWTPLGAGSRITGGWEVTGLSLPSRGLIRVLSRAVAGQQQSSGGLLGTLRPYHFTGSEIAVEQPADRPVLSGGSRDFGLLPVGAATSLTFTVRNFGDSSLTVLAPSISGSSDFVITSLPASPLAGPTGSTTFTVRFSPSSPGLKGATLSIANNTPGSNPYQIALTGTGATDGAVNTGINLAITAAGQPDDGVHGTIEQPDGRTVVFGQFSSAGGRARSGIFRLGMTGAVEAAYHPNVSGVVRAAVLQADGKLIIGGGFGSVGGQPRSNIARLHPDGTLDASFTASVDNAVWALALQPDGRVIAAGQFTNAGSTPRGYVARFHGDGSLDTSFADPACSGFAWGLRLQPDGKLIVMGFFTSIAGASRSTVARLNGDGTLDATFATTPNNVPTAALLQPDGKIVLGGFFTTINGTNTGNLVRLHPDGSLDAGFNAAVNNTVYGLALQSDGRLLVSGAFTGAGGLTRIRTVRLHGNGSGDPTFTADTSLSTGDSAVFGIGLVAGGQVNIGGFFDTVNGATFVNYARLYNTTATPSLNVPTADTVEWLRDGTAPQAQWTQFELSTNGGASWSPLGVGAPITGGWRITGLGLPAAGLVRARALVPGGRHTGSSGFVEQTASFNFNPLQVWRALHGLAANGSQDLGNPSGDGIANVIKFAFNTAPNAGDLAVPNVTVLPENGVAGLPFIDRDAQGQLVIEFIRRKATTNPGIAYTVETGDDLANLQPLSLSGASVVSIDATWERVTVTDPTITPARFGRVRLTVLSAF